ncbi:hypothetical protein [Variovorax sp. Sphag1AA]|uniref:hypothetical protein n=1 Tax=Variovorax sp. Sphag1AA TaxID=2587027 RepID=UPI00161B8C59|nr:hypothetical protein [Variovorax sp. Sphag1AA]MBB3175794.1 hypothetical protein [Variovorax sp. Sphag1AA]
MSVICPACQTENRDAAMFCHGCARKLPNFHPTQPSMLETMRAMPARPIVSTATIATPLQIEPRSLVGLWVGVGVAVFVLLASIAAWYVHLLRKPSPPVPPPAVASHVERPATGAPPVVATDKSKTSPATPETVSLGASLDPGETAVTLAASPALPPAAASPPVAALTPTPPPVERRQPPRAAPPTRVGALDPRSGCETLNFVFAARCEAAHCDKPQYASHPRCDLVRQQRKRDELHRNPTLAF